jgi:hypothetical protein
MICSTTIHIYLFIRSICKETTEVRSITDKLIRASLQTWQTLRTAAFYQNTHIKAVLDDLVNKEFND